MPEAKVMRRLEGGRCHWSQQPARWLYDGKRKGDFEAYEKKPGEMGVQPPAVVLNQMRSEERFDVPRKIGSVQRTPHASSDFSALVQQLRSDPDCAAAAGGSLSGASQGSRQRTGLGLSLGMVPGCGNDAGSLKGRRTTSGFCIEDGQAPSARRTVTGSDGQPLAGAEAHAWPETGATGERKRPAGRRSVRRDVFDSQFQGAAVNTDLQGGAPWSPSGRGPAHGVHRVKRDLDGALGPTPCVVRDDGTQAAELVPMGCLRTQREQKRRNWQRTFEDFGHTSSVSLGNLQPDSRGAVPDTSLEDLASMPRKGQRQCTAKARTQSGTGDFRGVTFGTSAAVRSASEPPPLLTNTTQGSCGSRVRRASSPGPSHWLSGVYRRGTPQAQWDLAVNNRFHSARRPPPIPASAQPLAPSPEAKAPLPARPRGADAVTQWDPPSKGGVRPVVSQGHLPEPGILSPQRRLSVVGADGLVKIPRRRSCSVPGANRPDRLEIGDNRRVLEWRPTTARRGGYWAIAKGDAVAAAGPADTMVMRSPGGGLCVPRTGPPPEPEHSPALLSPRLGPVARSPARSAAGEGEEYRKRIAELQRQVDHLQAAQKTPRSTPRNSRPPSTVGSGEAGGSRRRSSTPPPRSWNILCPD
eukprot:Hpha_TRINITY_DN15194_c0_g5::TRINITY_DN15194_c0_g5_i3::g.126742::m.126742